MPRWCCAQESLREELLEAQAEAAQLKQLLADHGLVWLGAPRSTCTRSNTHSSRASDAELPDCEPRDARDVCSSKNLRTPIDTATDFDAAAPAYHLQHGRASGGACAPHTAPGGAMTARQARKVLERPKSPRWVAECLHHLRVSLSALNAVAACEPAHLISTPWGAARAASVSLTVWGDGLQLAQQPLLRWNTEGNAAMLRDILEGVPAMLTVHALVRRASPLQPTRWSCRRLGCS